MGKAESLYLPINKLIYIIIIIIIVLQEKHLFEDKRKYLHTGIITLKENAAHCEILLVISQSQNQLRFPHCRL